jgi:hypothetical protein
MGHISDLPADVLWLILRRAMYVDCAHPSVLDSVIIRDRGTLSLERTLKENVICIVVRYAVVNRRWLQIFKSKVRRFWPGWKATQSWKFVNGAWAGFVK